MQAKVFLIQESWARTLMIRWFLSYIRLINWRWLVNLGLSVYVMSVTKL